MTPTAAQQSAREETMTEITPMPASAALPAETANDALLGLIERAARDPQCDVAKMRELLDLRREWERDEARKAFTTALADFKADPPSIIKNKRVEYGRTAYDHATLDEVVHQVVPALARHGLTHAWSTAQNGAEIKVTCTLTHRDGHSESVTLAGPPDDSGQKNPIQQIASALTYLQRYSLLQITGLAAGEQDTDGGVPDALISAENIARLNAKLEETGADRAAFLKFCKVEAIEDLTERKFPVAWQALQERARKAAERQLDAQADHLAAG